jgi:hypothetical protein
MPQTIPNGLATAHLYRSNLIKRMDKGTLGNIFGTEIGGFKLCGNADFDRTRGSVDLRGKVIPRCVRSDCIAVGLQ